MMLMSTILMALAQMPVAQAEDEAATTRRVEIQRRLSARDAGPTCAEVEAMSPEPVADLVWLVEHVRQPPWVGIRAAACLMTEHGQDESERLHQWAVDPDRKGLAILLLVKLDELPAPLAHSLGQAVLAGPHKELARPRLVQSQHKDVRALVEAD